MARLLAVDYGYDHTGFGETLQAVKAHQFVDPLAEPGVADLTTHVDFAALARARPVRQRRRSSARSGRAIFCASSVSCSAPTR